MRPSVVHDVVVRYLERLDDDVSPGMAVPMVIEIDVMGRVVRVNPKWVERLAIVKRAANGYVMAQRVDNFDLTVSGPR